MAKINAAESVAVNVVSLVEAGIVLSLRTGEDARLADEPLLAKGDDFSRTDIEPA